MRKEIFFGRMEFSFFEGNFFKNPFEKGQKRKCISVLSIKVVIK